MELLFCAVTQHGVSISGQPVWASVHTWSCQTVQVIALGRWPPTWPYSISAVIPIKQADSQDKHSMSEAHCMENYKYGNNESVDI